MSDEDHITERAVLKAERQRPHRRAIVVLSMVAAALSLVAVTALALGVQNLSAQNASVACQGQLQQNQDAQNVAGIDSRLLLRNAGQVLADGTAKQADAVAVILDPSSSRDTRSAALVVFQQQAADIANAWQVYVTESAKADKVRAENPTTFRC